METVDILRVPKAGPADGLGERLLRVWDRHQMDMVGHQAVSQDLQAVLLGLLLQQLQIHLPVLVREEHVLAVIPALCDMMGTAHGNGSG
jgi:hypothetical protein